MKAGEYVPGTCSWDPVAPLRLRRQALKNVSEWRSYSTARFLDGLQETRLLGRVQDGHVPSVRSRPFGSGESTAHRGNGPCNENSNPTVLRTIDVGDSQFDSAMSVELLPSSLAERWQSIGLRFATENDMSDMRFMETLAKSLDLIRLVRPLHGTVAGMCRSLHVLLASCRHLDISYSDPSLPFSIFVSCPPVTEENRVERLAENVIHEALHLQLSLVERVEPLIIDGAEHELVFSPWKEGERTMRGLLHAVYVFGNLRCFWKRVAPNCPNSSIFAENRIETINQEMSSVRHLLDSPLLTATGRCLASASIIF